MGGGGNKRQLLPLIALRYFIGPEKGVTLFFSLISFALFMSVMVKNFPLRFIESQIRYTGLILMAIVLLYLTPTSGIRI